MNADRPNLYREIHKAVRSMLAHLVGQAGRTDFGDAAQVVALRREIEQGFALLESHAAHEERFLAPLLRAHVAAVAASLDAEHDDQAARMAQLRALLVEAEGTGSAAIGHAFVVALSRFAGELLTHMADEEEHGMTALWAALDDGALARVHQELVGSIAPDEMMRTLAWMLPAINARERAELLLGLRAGAPPQALEAVRELARRVLAAADWAQLEARLEPVAA